MTIGVFPKAPAMVKQASGFPRGAFHNVFYSKIFPDGSRNGETSFGIFPKGILFRLE
ncbi:hypothetical protein ACFFUE_00735 [Bergeyella porcorum]|uniref:hypothetical protein n=1 Tax=Bergeyella porcorum TaxID=1735111 RepID=UPI0035EEDEAE